ncbi:amidohydrolase family protein [Celeribacter sp.]|uniref:amidohydrolase family protein n=1 Tax=Celeribacter sp. TaxID=1890673 RepID=UPI003A94DC41
MLFDTHLHLIDRTRLSYPWLSEAKALDRDWTYEEYAQAARRVGITDTLHMEVDVAEEDIDAECDMVAELMAREDTLMRGAIASTRPESDSCAAMLERLDRNVVKGIRRVIHVMPDDLSQTPLFRENVRRIGEANLPFDICADARQLGIAAELVDACENTQFVLDHCGVPDIAGEAYAPWAAAMAEIAKRPNIVAKISGITAYSAPDWTLDTLRPYVEHVIACFGWDRVVWGSDSPVCTLNSNLDQWVAATLALTQGASETEREKFFSANAKRIWNIEAG